MLPHDAKPVPTELHKRLVSTANEMAALQEELYWLAQDENNPAQQRSLEELNIERIMELKLAVDNLRDVLWKFIDAAAEAEPVRVLQASETSKLRRVTRFLEVLRRRLVPRQDQQPVSFIEKISASVKEKLAGPGGRAA